MNDTYTSFNELMNEYLGESIEYKLEIIAENLADEVRYVDGNPTYSFNTIQQFLANWKRV